MKRYTSDERRDFAQGRRRLSTRSEDIIWSAIRASRLDGFKFKREVPFGPYVPDFSCASARLIVEIDGRTHDTLHRAVKDEERDCWFERQGGVSSD